MNTQISKISSGGVMNARKSVCAAGSHLQTTTSGRVRSASRAGVVRVSAYRYRDSAPLRKVKEAQNKHILSTYNKAYAFFPKVKFVLKHNSRLGEVWKLSGNSPELGNWLPENSPCLHWKEGGIWSAEVALPPGTYSFKCMLRRADGSYVWESGENRHLVVPIKERAGHFVMTYHMDVRTEPVESLQLQPGKYGVMRQGEQLDVQELPNPAYSNGRVMVGAGARY